MSVMPQNYISEEVNDLFRKWERWFIAISLFQQALEKDDIWMCNIASISISVREQLKAINLLVENGLTPVSCSLIRVYLEHLTLYFVLYVSDSDIDVHSNFAKTISPNTEDREKLFRKISGKKLDQYYKKYSARVMTAAERDDKIGDIKKQIAHQFGAYVHPNYLSGIYICISQIKRFEALSTHDEPSSKSYVDNYNYFTKGLTESDIQEFANGANQIEQDILKKFFGITRILSGQFMQYLNHHKVIRDNENISDFMKEYDKLVNLTLNYEQLVSKNTSK